MGEKTSCLQIRKIKKKNQIPKYHTFSLIKTMKKICEQSVDVKPSNLMGYWGGKLKDL